MFTGRDLKAAELHGQLWGEALWTLVGKLRRRKFGYVPLHIVFERKFSPPLWTASCRETESGLWAETLEEAQRKMAKAIREDVADQEEYGERGRFFKRNGATVLPDPPPGGPFPVLMRYTEDYIVQKDCLRVKLEGAGYEETPRSYQERLRDALPELARLRASAKAKDSGFAMVSEGVDRGR